MSKTIQQLIVLFIFVVLFYITYKSAKNRGVFYEVPKFVEFQKPVIEDHGEQNSEDYFLAVREHRNFMKNTRQEDEYIPNVCQIEDWNKIETNTIPHNAYHNELIKRKAELKNVLLNKTPSPFSAFAYSDHIAVTLTSEQNYSKTVYCRYFDCKMKEITKPFESRIFPQSTVFCGRRSGAEYISVTFLVDDEPEFPVRIVRRDMKHPKHYFTVCLSPLYGEEPKFLQIVDFIEYYKLQGATFFHIYVRNVSNYDRVLLDDYVRTGDVEVIKMHDHYWRADFMWHRVQINECHRRSVKFAKWTAFIDIDERIVMKKLPELRIVDMLEQMTPNVSTIHFSIDWVVKDQQSPAKYINDTQLENEMIFRKFHNTSTKTDTYKQPKCIIRPDKIAIMTIHHPVAVYSDSRISVVNYRIAAVRHYRNSFHKLFPGQVRRMMQYGPWNRTDVAPWIAGNLTERILKRVKYLYNIEQPTLSAKRRMYGREGSEMRFEKLSNSSIST